MNGYRETGGAFGIRRDAIGKNEMEVGMVIQHPSEFLDIDEVWQLEMARALWPQYVRKVYDLGIPNLC